jgi:hypothetical protein
MNNKKLLSRQQAQGTIAATTNNFALTRQRTQGTMRVSGRPRSNPGETSGVPPKEQTDSTSPDFKSRWQVKDHDFRPGYAKTAERKTAGDVSASDTGVHARTTSRQHIVASKAFMTANQAMHSTCTCGRHDNVSKNGTE